MSESTPAVEPLPEVILFEHPNFRGAHRHIFGRENDLSITNKVNPADVNAAGGDFAGPKLKGVTSSIIVVRGTWEFFAAKNCDGHGEVLKPDKYPDFNKIGLEDNKLLSLKPK
jgi:hypothetical protein